MAKKWFNKYFGLCVCFLVPTKKNYPELSNEQILFLRRHSFSWKAYCFVPRQSLRSFSTLWISKICWIINWNLFNLLRLVQLWFILIYSQSFLIRDRCWIFHFMLSSTSNLTLPHFFWKQSKGIFSKQVFWSASPPPSCSSQLKFLSLWKPK